MSETPGAPGGGQPLGNPFGGGDALSITPPSPTTDISRVPSPQELGRRASAWIGRDPMTGEEISGTGDIFAQATEGERKARPSGALRFQTPSGRAVLPKSASEDTWSWTATVT
jgi:hypothetical protein